MMELLQLCKLQYPSFTSLIQSAIDAYQLQIVTALLLLTSVTQQYLFIYSFICFLLTTYVTLLVSSIIKKVSRMYYFGGNHNLECEQRSTSLSSINHQLLAKIQLRHREIKEKQGKFPRTSVRAVLPDRLSQPL